jgi:hypothetical protein
VARQRVAAVVTGSPFSVELALPLPDRTDLETLRQRSEDPGLSSGQQAVAQQGFRVAEVLYEKQNADREIRTASIRKKEHLQHVREGFAAAAAAASPTVSDFVTVCRNRSRQLGLDEQGWNGWLASLG